MYAEVKSYEDKLDTAHYKNTTIRILDDLEPLTKYIIEHSGSRSQSIKCILSVKICKLSNKKLFFF